MKQPKQTKTEIDITNATERELLQIPGIGPALAAQIIAARQNKTITVPIDGRLVPLTDVSQEELVAIQEAANAQGCSVAEFTQICHE